MRPAPSFQSVGWWVFLAAAVVLVTVAPGAPGFRDAGELGAAAAVLGVPHPTGFPIQMLLLHLAGLVPLGAIALRQNGAVAVESAAVLGLVAHVAETLARRAGVASPSSRVGAVVAAVALGAWATFLGTALLVEVYSGALLLVALAAVLCLARPEGGALPAVALVAGLSLGAHVSARVGIAPLLFAAFVVTPRERRVRSLTIAALAATTGALVVAYLPLAALRGAPLDWGNPRTLLRFWDVMSAERIRSAYAGAMGHAPADAAAALGGQLIELAPVGLPALVGALLLYRRAPRLGLVLVLVSAAALDVAYAVLVNPMGIADRQVGHLTGAVVAVLGGVGVAFGVDRACHHRVAHALALASATVLAVAIALGASTSLAATPDAASDLYGSGGTFAALPPRAIVLCSDDDACGSLYFARWAEESRPDTAVVPAQHLWEPTIRGRLGPLPVLRAFGRQRAATAQTRGRLATRVVAALCGAGGLRPVFVESPETSGVRTVLAALPPWLVPRGAPHAATRRQDPIVAFDAVRRARLGAGPPRSAAAREAWSGAYDHMGRAALEDGRTRLAVRAYTDATRIAPDRAVPWTDLGVALADTGAVGEAIAASRAALLRDPSAPTPWVNLVRFVASRGAIPRARRIAQTAARAGITDPRLVRLRIALNRASAVRAPTRRSGDPGGVPRQP